MSGGWIILGLALACGVAIAVSVALYARMRYREERTLDEPPRDGEG